MCGGRMTCFDEVYAILEARGEAAYLGEPVSQKEHALQAAYLAEQNGASDSLIVAALLHDIGHLVGESAEEPQAGGLDGQHEKAGRLWVAQWFGPEVTEPIRLHVAAKRYLCYVTPAYLTSLSAASIASLELQGGAFSESEASDFET